MQQQEAQLACTLNANTTANTPFSCPSPSTQDGYAVLASDGAGDFPLAGESRPGALPAAPLAPGTVAYITTGAPVPAGADAVVQVEDTERLAGADGAPRVRILKAAKPGQDIRAVGSDIE